MKYILVIFFAAILMISNSAKAIIHGENIIANTVSTVNLNIKHQHYLRSSNLWDKYESNCSAVIVGTNPLTLISASHCFKEASVDALQLPILNIENAEDLGISQHKLIKALLKPYEDVEKNVGLDIAVLIFEASIDETVVAIPIKKNIDHVENVYLCGFGLGYLDKKGPNPKCGNRKILKSVNDFYQILPESYEISDQMLHIKARAQFNHKQEITNSANTLLAVNRLDDKGKYSETLPMPTFGDSGGPWLIHENGRYSVVAISSYVERFYNKSVFWKFFNRDTPLSEYPYIAYGVRLGEPEIQKLLDSAIKEGADIQFN
jgi:hypothetical protein